jgi:hypothetical protein
MTLIQKENNTFFKVVSKNWNDEKMGKQVEQVGQPCSASDATSTI